MKIAITGASGFLGRHLIERLRGSHQLLALSRRGTAPAGVPCRSVDVLDPAALTQAFRGQDIVIHAAGMVSHEAADAARTWAVHVDGTRNVIAAAEANGVRRLLHISSSGTVAISDSPDHIATEDSPWALHWAGAWPYYRSKIFAEKHALDANGPDLEVVSLNPSLLLGPGDDLYGSSTECIRIFLDDAIPMTPAGGLAYVDVRDVADATALALTAGQPGQRYLISSCNISFFDFYSRLARITGRKAPLSRMPDVSRKVLSWLPRLGQDGGIGGSFGASLSREELELASHFWYCDSTRAREELGWQPRDATTTLDDTLADILVKRNRPLELYGGA